jgi:hypothetical protein
MLYPGETILLALLQLIRRRVRARVERVRQAVLIATWPLVTHRTHEWKLWRSTAKMTWRALQGHDMRGLLKMRAVTINVQREAALGKVPGFRPPEPPPRRTIKRGEN